MNSAHNVDYLFYSYVTFLTINWLV